MPFYRGGGSTPPGGAASPRTTSVFSQAVHHVAKKKKKKADSGGGGFLGTGIGPDFSADDIVKGVEGVGNDIVGLGSLAVGATTDLGKMVGNFAAGNQNEAYKSLNDFTNKFGGAATGFVSSVAGTAGDIADVSTYVPLKLADETLGTDLAGGPGKLIRAGGQAALTEAANLVSGGKHRKAAEQVGEALGPKSYAERASERGFLSPLVEDIGNIALVGKVGSLGADAAVAAREGQLGAAVRHPGVDVIGGLGEETKFGRAAVRMERPLKGSYENTLGRLTQAARERVSPREIPEMGPVEPTPELVARAAGAQSAQTMMPGAPPVPLPEPPPPAIIPLAEKVLAARSERPLSAVAERIIGKLNPEGHTVAALNKLEGYSEAHAVKGAARQLAQLVEASRNQLAHTDMASTNVNAARFLIDNFKVKGSEADTIVGTAVENALSPKNAIFNQYPELHPWLEKLGVHMDPLPEGVRAQMTPEQLTEWDSHISKAVTATKTALDTRVATLAQSRPGLKGLEDIGTNEVRMTKAQAKQVKDAQTLLKRAAKEQVKSYRELASAQATASHMQESVVKMTNDLAELVKKGDAEVDRFLATRQPSKGVGWRNEEKWLTETIPEITRLTTEEGGATWNPYTGKFITPQFAGGDATGYAVTVNPGSLFEVTPEELPRFLNLMRGMSPLFENPSFNVGTWMDEGVVHIDVSEVVPDRATAMLKGNARLQDSIVNLGDPSFDTAFVSTQHVGDPRISAEVLKGDLRSRSRVGKQLYDGIGPDAKGVVRYPNLRMSDIDNHMASLDWDAVMASRADPKRFPTPASVYSKMDFRWGRDTARIDPNALQQRLLMRPVDTALWEEARANVADFKAKQKWYFRSHDGIESYFRGREFVMPDGTTQDGAELAYDLIALTSVNADPITNLGNATRALANLKNATPESMAKTLLDLQKTPPKGRLDIKGVRELTDESHMYDAAKRTVALRLTGNRPLMEWDNAYVEQSNAEFGGAVKSLKSNKVPQEAIDTLGEERATMEYHGGSALAKIKSFRDNLANPHLSTAVTLDSWMARLFGIKDWGGKGAYLEYATKLRSLAEEISAQEGHAVTPHEVQAGLWAFAKQEITRQTVGEFLAAAVDTAKQVRDGTWKPGDDPLRQWLQSDLNEVQQAQYRTISNKGKTAQRAAIIDKLRASGSTLKDAKAQADAEVVNEPGAFLPTERNVEMIDPNTKQRVKTTITTAIRSGSEKFNKTVYDRINEYDEVATQMHDQFAGGDIDGATKTLTTWSNGIQRSLNRAGEGVDFGDLLNGERALPAKLQAAVDDLGYDLFQRYEDQINGTFQEKNGRLVTRFFDTADATTLTHERGHMLEHLLGPELKGQIERAYEVKNSEWSRAHSERFADDLTSYMSGATAPKGLEGVFARLKAVLAQSYSTIMQGLSSKMVSPDTAAVFDKWFEDPGPMEMDPVAGYPELQLVEGTNIPFKPGPTGSMRQQLRATPELESASKTQAYQKGVSAAQSVSRLQDIQGKIQKQLAARGQVEASRTELMAQMAEGSLPHALAETELRGKASAKFARVAEALDKAPGSRWPREWQPVGRAFDDLAKLAEKDPELASVLEDIPTSFTSVLKRAGELGFDPTHVRDFTDAQVKKLMFDTIRLGEPGRKVGQEVTAGTRKASTGALTRQGRVNRSIEALGAAIVETQHELRSNQLVDIIESHIARPIKTGEALPVNAVEWDPVRSRITGKEGEPVTPGTRYVIPKQVDTVLKRMNQDYTFGMFRALTRVTNPWRALVLTLSPRWYVNNFFGNIMLATQEGVRLQDWSKAWKSYRNKDTGGRFADVPAVSGHSFVSDINEKSWVPTKNLREAWNTGDTVPEKIGKVRTQVGHNMRRANEAVDEIARAAVYHRTLRVGGSPELAVSRAYNALVDYGNLSPFEQQIVRAAVPFYSWQKGVLKIVTRMPIDHPIVAGLAMQLGALNRQLLEDRYGTTLPFGYAGLAPFGSGGINTRGMNPFADALSLTTPDGIAGSLNPFLNIAVRKALGAPEGGFVEQRRLSAYGIAEPDVNVEDALLNTATGIPSVQLGQNVSGSGNFGPGQQALKFVGINYMTADDVQKVLERVKAARAQIESGAPFPATKKKKRKRRASSSSGRSGSVFG